MAHVEIGLRRPARRPIHLQSARGRIDWAVGFGLALFSGEQRIALELSLYEGVELKVGQLQKLDRLLQLGCDDKALTLPKL
jgi:hypothetical protein